VLDQYKVKSESQKKKFFYVFYNVRDGGEIQKDGVGRIVLGVRHGFLK